MLDQFEIGCIILILFILFDRKTVRVQWDSLAKFQVFIVVVALFRISLFSYFGEDIYVDRHVILSIPVYKFSLVFWEDAFHVLPFVFLRKFRWTSKWYVWYPLFVLMSVHFGMGHMYQGMNAAVILFFYPYFISYKWGKKVGFGTVMLSHIMYDFFIIYTIKLLPILL